jgi:hypothetical protein
MRKLLLIAALAALSTQAIADPTIELTPVQLFSGSYIRVATHIRNDDDVWYGFVRWKCQLFDRDDKPFFVQPYDIIVFNVQPHRGFTELHDFTLWGYQEEMYARAECRLDYKKTYDTERNYNEDRKRRYD